MITIVMDANKNLKLNSTAPIYQFENNADEIMCLLPSIDGSFSLADCEVKLCFSNGKQEGNTLMLSEKYNNNYLSYKCPMSLDMTAYAGQLSVWIEASGTGQKVLLRTNAAELHIIETINLDADTTEKILPLLNRWVIEMTQIKNTASESLRQATEQANLAAKSAGLVIKVLQDIQGGEH